MVRSLTNLENLMDHRKKQTITEWSTLVKSVADSLDENIREQTGLPIDQDSEVSFEAYLKWVTTLGRVKSWNVERGPHMSGES